VTPEQTAGLLTYIARGDSRVSTDTANVSYWHDLVGDLEFVDAYEAVREHRMTSEVMLQPVHVRKGAALAGKRRRAAELAAQQQMTAIESGPAVFQRTDDQQEHVSNRAAWLRAELEKLTKAKSVPAEPTATVKDPA